VGGDGVVASVRGGDSGSDDSDSEVNSVDEEDSDSDEEISVSDVDVSESDESEEVEVATSLHKSIAKKSENRAKTVASKALKSAKPLSMRKVRLDEEWVK